MQYSATFSSDPGSANFHSCPSPSMSAFYNLKATTNKGAEYDFEQLRGKVVLISNTASRCTFAPQYGGMQELHAKYKDQGLVVLGFPCNQFNNQEPGSDEKVAEYCMINHGVDFQLMTKSDVNGPDTNEVFKYLKSQQSSFGLSQIKWNFEKFLVDRKGNVISRWTSIRTPKALEPSIEKLLAEES